MSAVALGNGNSNVSCTDGIKGSPCGTAVWHWDTESIQTSDQCSTNVFVNSIGVVRKDDTMISHPDGTPCTSSAINHAPALSTYSSTVFVNGKNIGRVGDKYDSDSHYDHTISTGSNNVFSG